MGERIDLTIEDRIAVATLNRPDKGNPFDWTSIAELNAILERVEKDDAIGGLILTAGGEKYFSVGADISLMQDIQGKEYAEFLFAGMRMCETIQRLRKPTLAAVNGWAVGAGGEVAMACDLRIASENARLGVPELKIGLIPGWGGVFRLTRLVGPAKAMELVLTATNLPAAEAERIGLVNRVVPPGELMTAAKGLMGRVLANAPVAIAFAKSIILSEREVPVGFGETYEALSSILTFLSHDGKEGMRAFFEKRKPEWKGE